MNFSIAVYPPDETSRDAGIEMLLYQAYVDAGFTAPDIARQLFSAGEVKKRGTVILATDWVKAVLGMVIVGTAQNPYKQVAGKGEAEMQLLATDPGVRGEGVGEALCRAFEAEALKAKFTQAVLSTQPAMEAAHKLYAKLGYERNPTRDWERNGRQFWVYEKSLFPLSR